MRRCANCGAINRDGKSQCGVCGQSLTRTTPANLGPATQTYESSPPLRTRWRVSARAMLLAGLGLLAAGGVALFLQGILGAILLLSGLVVLIDAVEATGNERKRPWRTQKGMGGKVASGRIDTDKRELEKQASKAKTED